MNNPNTTGCNVKATISVLKFPQVQGSLQHARKVALDQIAYEIEARGLKSLKILGLSRCNDGVRGVSDSPEGMTPQSLAPKDQMTPPWKK